ncbi:hypothetical protein CMO92_01745 [Candidatus Woesearchaeota archaeon]|nr:hypothetical protein [Candidatus Woesearchaeota archaeon]|tara:strand:- start:1452 stop:1742 length:291 start_codon:yes stop_codon:yes gene_type:complete
MKEAPTVQEIMGKNYPQKKFKAGAIEATIWLNEGTRDGSPVQFQTISLRRSYKDKNNEWKDTHSLRTSDLPKAILVLNKAYEYVALRDDAIAEESA